MLAVNARRRVWWPAGFWIVGVAILTAAEPKAGRAAPATAAAPCRNGFLFKNDCRVFPLGFYELPKDDSKLNEMARAGVNLVRCGSRADLDRLQAAGMLGVMTLNVQQGDSEALRKRIAAVTDHPALAVWEGPDEIVWSFTASSRLFRTEGVYKSADEWMRQTPLAVQYSESRAAEVLPKLREGIRLLRGLDPHNRPVWMNEAYESDVKFVGQYLDDVDITGCDLYPVKQKERPVADIGLATDRWNLVARGKPVWMVLQAFSWHELGDYYGHKVAAYPTFAESRFMAYDALVHGARGILYWGSRDGTPAPFRQSLHALISELNALQPFLVVPNDADVHIVLIEPEALRGEPGVKAVVRRAGRDALVIVVNEDDDPHMAVELSGLAGLDGQQLDLLYGSETATPRRGELVVRMQPREVKVFATGRAWETTLRAGRDYQ